ncbi:LBH regulator of WNT signaling pathway [Rhinolophus ferrumequinum]|uniref:Protein LBH n=1 Tax=Rhinolophus ferrumequinum TaxID=59479 RepID=A0A7J7V835_RHIFE|nr:LBH regulator of WNT signaling pathway [Rhinolophus ferrumequinum]
MAFPIREQSSLATKQNQKFNAQTSPKDLKDLIVQLLIFPDPSDFDRCCKLKDRLPSIVVEPTEGEVESGELRWPPEEFLVQEDEQDNCEETAPENKEQ